MLTSLKFSESHCLQRRIDTGGEQNPVGQFAFLAHIGAMCTQECEMLACPPDTGDVFAACQLNLFCMAYRFV